MNGTFRTIAAAFIILCASGPAAGETALPRHPRTPPGGFYGERAVRELAAGRFAAPDTLRIIVFRAAFSDTTFLPEHGDVWYGNELRHLREYFDGASRGRFALRCDLAPGITVLSRSEAYYGEDGAWDARMAELLMELVPAVDDAIDFARYDGVAVIHAGAGQETDFVGDSARQLWSGFIDPNEMAAILADTLGTPGIPTDDRRGADTVFVDNLMVWPEDASQDGYIYGAIGIYAYQVGLRLGMVPLFDTTPSSYPDSQGIGSFGLMSYGLYNAAGFVPAFPCAFHRYLMGWLDAVDVTTDARVRLGDCNSPGAADTSLIRIPVSAHEYFLVVNRLHDADLDGIFDFGDIGGLPGVPDNEDTLLGAEFDFFLTATTNPSETIDGIKRTSTGSGIYVWHVDERVILERLAAGGRPNDEPGRKGVDLEEADGIQDLDRPGGAYAFGSYFDSFRAGSAVAFGPATAPSSLANSGVPTGVLLDGIPAAAPAVTFDVRFVGALPRTDAAVEGLAGLLGPVPADLDGDGLEELVLLADTGYVHIVRAASSADWAASVETVHVPGALWAGSPVVADTDGDGSPEIYAVARGCRLLAFDADGSFHPIDDDATPGSFTLADSLVTAPVVFEADGDDNPEIGVVSSTRGDTLHVYIAGYDLPAAGDLEQVAPRVVRFSTGREFAAVLTDPARIRFTGQAAPDTLEGICFMASSRYNVLYAVVLGFEDEGVCIWQGEGIGPATPVPPLPAPAVADIDGDGADDMIWPRAQSGLLVYSPDGMQTRRYLVSVDGDLSSAALSDVDGDGLPETAFRDRGYFRLVSPSGSTLFGWPGAIPGEALSFEADTLPAPPVIADVDGDGAAEIVFSAAGDLYALETDGRSVAGWPLPGGGAGGSSPAVLLGNGDARYLFAAGDERTIASAGQTGIGPGASRTVLTRYELPLSEPGGKEWRCYRRDASGGSRLEPAAATDPAEGLVDERSFVVYPNPATGGTVTIRVDVHRPADVRLRILTVQGEPVLDEARRHSWAAGSRVPFEMTVSTDAMAGGIYICVLEVLSEEGSWRGARKFAVIR
ncbi:MAG: VCBS repeat-containing protein [Candidatus Krumholzibacteriota bacterium]|nr:VCBS repeat-containing protein [Candidatus Krumholzibacteriota bacterium]